MNLYLHRFKIVEAATTKKPLRYKDLLIKYKSRDHSYIIMLYYHVNIKLKNPKLIPHF